MKTELQNVGRRAAWLFSLMIAVMAPSAPAQDSLKISKHPDFSTADKAFTFNETLYVQVKSPRIDYTYLDKNELHLKPAGSGDEVNGAFINHFNGTYATAVPLSSLARSESNWEFRVEIKDRQDNGFRARANLTIQNAPPIIVELEGRIEALTANFLQLSGQMIFVEAATTVMEFGQPLKFADLRVNWKVHARAERRADRLWWALTIEVLDRASTNVVETRGRLANRQDSVMIVNDIRFCLSAQTDLRGKDNALITLADFRAGMLVEASGTTHINGEVIAGRVKIEDDNFVDQEIEFTGTVESVLARAALPDSIRINGDLFEVDEQTELRGFRDEPVRLSDWGPGENAEIKAKTRQGRLPLALQIKRREPGGEVQVKGQIERLQDSSLVVSGVDFFRSATTIVLDDESLLIPFPALRLGLDVEVRANRQANGRLVATLIKIEDDGDEIELTGFIDELMDTSIEVAGSIFLVNSATNVFDQSGVRIAFFTLRPGMLVEIHGTRRFDGSVVATEIRIEDFFLGNDIELRGAIAALTANGLRVTEVDFFTDANTVILDLTGAPISLTQLAVGMIAEIRAKFLGNRWLASRVKIEDEIDNEMATVAAIDSLKMGAFHTLGRLVRGANNTIYLGFNNEPIVFATLQVNDVVSVRGRALPDGSFVALRVKRENRNMNVAEASGKITQRGAASVTVASITFAVDAATGFFDAENRPITFADLAAGQLAEVRGIRQINGALVASRIQLQNHRVLIGIVTSSFFGTVNVAGLQHVSASQSVFIDEQNRSISASEVRPGQQVRLVANAAGGQWEIVNLRILFSGNEPTTGADDSPQNSLPRNFVLYQNFPNPFFSGVQLNAATVIRFALPRPEEISLAIYNQLGQKIRTISAGRLPAGLHERSWDGRDDSGAQVASGVYFYRLQAGQQTKIQKLIVIR
ncbi:DUF5666 domain-containing protein [candidate division KSB1 bacterium]|nr:DUF5666 domain-containing protein [candidate division KSB1 bacterium]